MNLAHLIGRRLVVAYRLLKDLHVEFTSRGGGTTLLVVEGSIMESAKVFESVGVVTSDHTLFITIYASLPFWNRSGSPDFRATSTLKLKPGIYEIRYADTGNETVFLKQVEIKR